MNGRSCNYSVTTIHELCYKRYVHTNVSNISKRRNSASFASNPPYGVTTGQTGLNIFGTGNLNISINLIGYNQSTNYPRKNKILSPSMISMDIKRLALSWFKNSTQFEYALELIDKDECKILSCPEPCVDPFLPRYLTCENHHDIQTSLDNGGREQKRKKR